jgi:undecaprenyl phosphate N,N'-diacetylbacillosamine 1-phosphate transferase
VQGFYAKYLKRFFDIFFVLMFLLLFFWLYAIIALVVCIKMGSPVIYASDRIGRDEKIFSIYKFRSMTNAVDKNGVLLPAAKRLTRFGRILRSTSLDELPSLVNILRGEMSLVGPRPMLKKYQPYFYQHEKKRHSIRPGLTGWAQVNGRNNLSWDDKFAYDLYYVDNVSLGLDLKIIGKTLVKVFKRSDIVQGGKGLSLYDKRPELAPGPDQN